MQNYTQFANVTLISPHGLPFDNERNDVGARLLTFRGRFCPEYRHNVAARSWINIVHGTMIAINRWSPIYALIDYLELLIRKSHVSQFESSFLHQEREIRHGVESGYPRVRLFGPDLRAAVSETDITGGKGSAETRVTIVRALLAESLA